MKELGISSVSATAKKEYKNGRKGKTEIFYIDSSKPNGQIKSRSVISLFLGSVINTIVFASS